MIPQENNIPLPIKNESLEKLNLVGFSGCFGGQAPSGLPEQLPGGLPCSKRNRSSIFSPGSIGLKRGRERGKGDRYF